MKRIALLIGLILISFCGFGYSAINQWKSTDGLNATMYGEGPLKPVLGLTKILELDQSGAYKVYDAAIAVPDVKNISMRSYAVLDLTDENGQKYTTNLEVTNSLSLPNESNVVMINNGEIKVNSSNLGSPKVDWKTSLDFPADADLESLDLGSYLEQMPELDLQGISSYCEDHGIGYNTGCNIRFTDRNDDLGVTCNWGQSEKITVG